jgi:hypothetical protein
MPGLLRNIQITWTAVTGAVNYKVFRKKITEHATDFVLATTVAAPLVTYTFLGLEEDERDLFRVEAVDISGTTLVNATNAVQDISFPDRSAGIYTTNSSTPDGQPATIPVDVPYMTKDEFIKQPIARGLGIVATSPEYIDGTLDTLLLQASSHVNRYTRRYFQKQTIDETFPNVTIQVSNPRLTIIPLKNPPVSQINSVTIQVLRWFIPFSLEYLIQPFYEQHYYQIVPMLSTAGQGAPMGTGTPIPSVILEQSQLGIVWTNYTCGYDVIPEDIKEAVGIIAGKMFGMKHNPLGLSSFKTQTVSQTWEPSGATNYLDSEVMAILNKYRIPTLRFQ